MHRFKSFFISALLVFLSTVLIAQTKSETISVNLNKAPLLELIKTIENQTNYTFLINTSVNLDQQVSLVAHGLSITQVLNTALKGKGISYEIVGYQIILTNAVTSKRVVSGKVVDRSGQPIIGLTVVVKGTNHGVTTTVDGNYSIDVNSPDETLMFTCLGYKDQEIQIGKRERIDVIMDDVFEVLDEVLVIGYGTKNKNMIVGAVNQVSKESFEGKAVSNVGAALQGAIPNLNITYSDGGINTTASFNVRGVTSINGGHPLILIDGVPGDMDLISPEDIASVSVLKDASSAAIYGAQASYGVILVTTKSGESEKPRVRYSGTYGFSHPLKTPKILMNNQMFAIIMQEAYKGWAGSDLPDLTEIINYLQDYADNPTDQYGYVGNGYFSYITGKPTDWYGMIYSDYQPFSKNFLEVSGKSKMMNYYFSAGMTDQDGVYAINTDKLKKYNIRAKVEANLTGNISIYNNFSIENSKYKSPMTTVNGSWNILRYMLQLCSPFSSPYDNDGNYSYGGMVSVGLLKDGGFNNTTSNYVRDTFGGEIDFFNDALKLKADYSVWWDRNLSETQKFRLSYSTAPGVVDAFDAMTDYYNNAYSQTVRQTTNVYLDMNKHFGGHTISAIAGFNQDQSDYKMFNAQVKENMFHSYASLNLGEGEQTVSDSATSWITLGFFYRASYDYKQKYLLELNGRLDGTSRFPSDHRWGFFPSAAAGWVLSKEPFMAWMKPAVDLLKIRASYGALGNQQVNAYSYFSTISKNQADYLDKTGNKIYYMSTPGLVAGNLTWETVVTKNLGVDLAMLKNRLNLGLDVYERQTLNMLAAGVSLPSTLGATVPETNSADLSTKGWEASIMWRNRFKLFGKDANYSARFVVADNRSVITRFDGNDSHLISGYNVGEEIGTIWGYHVLGLFQSDEEASGWVDQKIINENIQTLKAGDVKFADLNKNGKIDYGDQTLENPGDMKRIGSTATRYPFSLDLAFDWAGFDLDIYLQGVGKRQFYPGPESMFFWGFYNRYYNPVMQHHLGNYWTEDNTDAYFPRLRAYMANTTRNELGCNNDRYLQNAAYMRLKTLTLGYTIPKKITEKINLSKARFYVTGQNLLTFTKLHEAFDPEATTNENSNGAGLVYPIQKTITFGIDLNF